MPSTYNNQPLTAWVKTKIYGLKGGAFLTVSVLSAAFNLFIVLGLKDLDRQFHMPILYGTQAVLIFIISLIIAFGDSPRLFRRPYPRGSSAVEQFWKWWPPLWFTWLILYTGLTIAEALPAAHAPTVGSDAVAPLRPIILFGLHQLNNAATLILLMLFHHLAKPSVPGDTTPEGDIFPEEKSSGGAPEGMAEKAKSVAGKFWFWGAVLFISALVELALVSTNKAEPALAIFSICYGVMGATATALVVGKLDDDLFGVPTFVIVFLFIYAGIQPSFDFLLTKSRPDGLAVLIAREVIVVIALVSKVVLFATIHWLSMTHRLLYYMIQNYSLYRGVDSHRQKFLRKLSDSGAARASDDLRELNPS